MENFKQFIESSGGQYLTAAAAVLVFLTAVGLVGFKQKSIKQMSVSAILLALALVTSFIGISMPLGGSITLCSMLFVIVIGLFYGPGIGLPAALAFGILQFAMKPYFFHPIQVLLDYVLGFGVLGFSGYFAKSAVKTKLTIGIILPMFMRFVASTISGYVFFAEYTPDGWNPLIYTIVYNGVYIFGEMLITLVIVNTKQFRNMFASLKIN